MSTLGCSIKEDDPMSKIIISISTMITFLHSHRFEFRRIFGGNSKDEVSSSVKKLRQLSATKSSKNKEA